MNQKRILGVDFGTKKIGIAVSDKAGNFALPKIVLPNDKDLMQNFEKIIKEENIEEVVIGESLDYKGEENAVMESVKKFKEQIEDKFNLQTHFEPEFLTSAQVRNTQEDGKMIDAGAAALILQSFLDKRGERSFLEEE